MSKYLNKNCSAQKLDTLEIEHVIRECLFAFPFMWASVLLLIDGPALSFQLPVGESQFLLMIFSLADLATLMVIIGSKPAVYCHMSAY